MIVRLGVKTLKGSGVGFYKNSGGVKVFAFSDSDWAKCLMTRRSVSGYCVFVNGNLVSWKSKKHVTLSKFLAEAEYRAMASATCEVMWVLKVLHDPDMGGLAPVTLYCDNKSAIQIAANLVMHSKTKHFDIDVHLVREKVASGLIKTEKVDSKSQVADILTKALGILSPLNEAIDSSSAMSSAVSVTLRAPRFWFRFSILVVPGIGPTSSPYSKESGSKVVFEDNSSCDTEGYGSVNYNGITFTRVAYVNGLKHNSFSQLGDANFKVLFTKTRGTIFNHNNEVLLIAPRRRDVYVIEMSLYNEESNTRFFAKASNSVNWLWHKRLSHLNFKNINKLAKQNLVAGLPSLTYSKDKPYSTYEKRKHHRASFKIKRSFSISKCLHIFHMDLFGLVKPKTISHNKSVVISFSFGADNVVKEI
nr:ribonuclease H-like domain-containing protein [Tanacetum cinerariifolium]